MDMMKCKYTESCGYDLCVPEFCHEYEPVRMTNSDLIRAMTDEELAYFLNNIVVCHHLRNAGECNKCPIFTAKPCDTEGILNWLQQPAKED